MQGFVHPTISCISPWTIPSETLYLLNRIHPLSVNLCFQKTKSSKSESRPVVGNPYLTVNNPRSLFQREPIELQTNEQRNERTNEPLYLIMAMAATKLSSQSPPFNPNRILSREQSRSPVQMAYGARSRSNSPYQDHPNNNPNRGTPGGVRRKMQYPTNPNSAHSNAIAKHTFEHNG